MLNTIVIGAGQAGLSIGHYLKRSQQDFVILDQGKEVGESWSNRYDSLVLFTPRMYDSLPGLLLEGDAQGLPTKDEIAVYLKRYAETFELPIKFQQEVVRVQHRDNSFYVETSQGAFQSKNVIIATGAFDIPRIPTFSQDLADGIVQLHSSDYKNPGQLAGGNVLVVGGGNSGAQIAVELSKERETFLAVSKGLSYLPAAIRDKSIFWWFDRLGLLKATSNSLLGKAIQKKGDPIFGYELKDAISRKEIVIKPKVTGGMDERITFEDMSALKVNNIIWATGFESKYPWLDIKGAFDEKGKVVHKRGVTAIEGLYFIGLPWQHRRGSALLQGVGADAAYIVQHLTHCSS
ncbi:MAG: flavin-containing monooxygenase [Lysinibacillus sp.]